MAEPFLGMIAQNGYNFAPRGWAFCNGQLLSIAQNTALFSLLGTTYGGNGQTTFALPDLRSRAMVGQGSGQGLSPYFLGQQGGQETVTLILTEIPSHNHPATFSDGSGSINATTTKATSASPSAGAVLGRAVDGSASPAAIPRIYAPSGTTPTTPLGGVNVAGNVTIGLTGNNVPVPNLAPYLGISHIIALEGIFPSRN